MLSIGIKFVDQKTQASELTPARRFSCRLGNPTLLYCVMGPSDEAGSIKVLTIQLLGIGVVADFGIDGTTFLMGGMAND